MNWRRTMVYGIKSAYWEESKPKGRYIIWQLALEKYLEFHWKTLKNKEKNEKDT